MEKVEAGKAAKREVKKIKKERKKDEVVDVRRMTSSDLYEIFRSAVTFLSYRQSHPT